MNFSGQYRGLSYIIGMNGETENGNWGVEIRVFGFDHQLYEKYAGLLSKCEYGYIARFGNPVRIELKKGAFLVKNEQVHNILPCRFEYFTNQLNNFKNTVIYTGAGISTAAGIYGMNELESTLCIKELVKVLDHCAVNCNQYASRYLSFLHSIETAEPTEAHKSIKRIQDACSCMVVTENFDRLHERLMTITIHSFHERIAALLKNKKLIVIGISKDHHQIISRYRKINGNAPIFIVNDHTPDNYITYHDIFFCGNINQLVPRIEKALMAG